MASTPKRTTEETRAGRRTGRPYDHSVDAPVLAEALDLLAHRDLARVTLDDIAARAGVAKTTLYRRWASKEELVLAAIRAAGRPPEEEQLPDGGSLRSELLAVVDSPWLGGPQRRLAIFAGLAAAAQTSERVAEVIRSEVIEPYVAVYHRLLQRSLDRGEIDPEFEPRLSVLAEVIPAMSSHRLSSDRAIDRSYFVSVVDNVVLAALMPGAPPTSSDAGPESVPSRASPKRGQP
ncbi:MAG: TetR/AcrR family transcriptional regulator [Dermatophilaceae bacterium]